MCTNTHTKETPIIKSPVINLLSWKCSFSYWGTSIIFIRMWFVCVSECGVQKHFVCFCECVCLCCVFEHNIHKCTESVLTSCFISMFVFFVYAYIPIHIFLWVSACASLSVCPSVCLCVRLPDPLPTPPACLRCSAIQCLLSVWLIGGQLQDKLINR